MNSREFAHYQNIVFEALQKEYGFSPPIRNIEILDVESGNEGFTFRITINSHNYNIYTNKEKNRFNVEKIF